MTSKKDFYSWLDSIGIIYPSDDEWLDDYVNKYNYYLIAMDNVLYDMIQDKKTNPKLKLQALSLVYQRGRDLQQLEVDKEPSKDHRPQIVFNVKKVEQKKEKAITNKESPIMPVLESNELVLEDFDFES
jgi:hypothetical protein